MIKHIAIAATVAAALALSTISASACPLEDAKKAAKKTSTSHPAKPKPTV